MKKYLLIGFLILTFSLICFAQKSSKIENFVKVKVFTDKTATYVGDRVKLTLEVTYPKDWGIEILTEDLARVSIRAVLPESLILEKAKVFSPIPWEDYWTKIKAVYVLFYPEKKHDAGIQFNTIKVRFKIVEKESKEPRQEVEIYEVETKPFVLGVRSTLTPTSNEIRDYKNFLGRFSLKAMVSLVLGGTLILFVLLSLVRSIIRFVKDRVGTEKSASIKKLLKAEYKKLNAMQILDSDQFCQILRRVMEIKTGMKASAMTSSEIKEQVLDKGLAGIITILEKHDESRYNPASKLDIEESKKELTEAKAILREWTTSKIRKFWNLLRKFLRGRKKDG